MKKIYHFPIKLIILSFFITVGLRLQAQSFVTIQSKKFMVNGCPIYFNGANTPWESWNDFGGSYNQSKWTQDMVDLKNKGINSTRIWFSCNGGGQPAIASDGTVSVPSASFWSNCDHLFQQAQTNGIYVMATMMSFDHTKTGNPNTNNWRAMMNDPNKIKTYVDNYLVPFVNRYKNNPYLWSIDLCNEIEWIAENSDNWKVSYSVLQRFIGMCAAGLHQSNVARTDGSKVLITMGSASVKWNGTKMPNGSNNSDGNKWSDANLKAQANNDANAFLDFYSPHYYGWMSSYYSSPFERTPAQYGMDDKACVVGEMPSRDPLPTPAMSLTMAFNNLKNGGWQGHMPWTSNITTNLTDEVGSLADFGTAALTFTNNNKNLVGGTCTINCSTPAPIVAETISYCQGAISVALTATGTSLKWYTNQTGGTGSSTAPIPATSAIGTTNYYVSQTLNGCEGTRATIVVTVNAAPDAPGVSSPITYCQGITTVPLTAIGINLKWYTLQNGGTSSASAPSPNSNTNGSTNYYVSQTVNGCEGPRATIKVTVNEIPSTPIVISPINYCQGSQAMPLTADGNALKWYAAQSGGNSSSNAPVPATNTSGTINYYVSQTINGCESSRGLIQVKTDARPTTAEAGPEQFITLTSATLSANQAGIGSGIWSVLSGSGSFNDLHNPATSVNGLNQGINEFKWTIVNGACASSDNVVIHVGQLPGVHTITGPDSVGLGTKGVHYSVPSTSGITYKWAVPNGATIISGQMTSSITVDFGNSGGNGIVTVVESNLFGSTISNKSIATGPVPSITGIYGETNVTEGQTLTYSVFKDPNNNTTYTWILPSGAVIESGQGTNSIVVTFPEGSSQGIISVTAQNAFGTGISELPVNVTPGSVTGIHSVSSLATLTAMPNPFDKVIHITFNTPSTSALTLKVYDMKGLLVYESDKTVTNEEIILNIEGPAGIYFVTGAYLSGSKTVKIKKH